MKESFVLLLAVLSLTLKAYSTIHRVPGQYPTIQAGVDAASNGDTVFVADGIYTGAGNKDIDFRGRNIVLTSAGNAMNCIIDCQNSGRGFYFHSGETSSAVVYGITVTHGSAILGSGVNITSASPTFKYCIIKYNLGNDVSYGGGVFITGGAPTFESCTIYGNQANQGAAIYSASDMIVNSCIVAANVAVY